MMEDSEESEEDTEPPAMLRAAMGALGMEE